MADNDNNADERPLGDRVRDFVFPALEDERRPEVQAALLNDIFNGVAGIIDKKIEEAFQRVAKQADAVEKSHPDQRNIYIIEQLTKVDPRTGAPLYSPILRVNLPINVAHTTFTADDIKDMPGYIALHEKARAINVALKLHGVAAEENKTPSPFPPSPMLIVDAVKTYEEGAFENAMFYPNLPPPPVKFDTQAPGKFKF